MLKNPRKEHLYRTCNLLPVAMEIICSEELLLGEEGKGLRQQRSQLAISKFQAKGSWTLVPSALMQSAVLLVLVWKIIWVYWIVMFLQASPSLIQFLNHFAPLFI